MTDSLQRIVYYENLLEFKEASKSSLLANDVNNWYLCRACLCTRGAEEFSKMCVIGMDGQLIDVEKMLKVTTGQEILPTDRLPKIICRECLNKLSTFYFFQHQVQRAEALLNRLMLKLNEAENVETTPINVQATTTLEEVECSSTSDNTFPIDSNVVDSNEVDMTAITNNVDIKCETKDDIVTVNNCNDIEEREAIVEYTEFNGGDDFELIDEYPEEETLAEEYYLERHDESNSTNDVITFNLINVETVPLGSKDSDANGINEVMTEITPTRSMEMIEVSESVPPKARYRNERTAQTQHSCGVCEMVFKKTTELIQHCQREHPNDKAFKCMDCGGTFAHLQSLNRHRMLHSTSQYNHVCGVCGKMFTRSDDWRRHMRIHTGQRPYSCTLCEKAFKQVNELKEHTLTHTKKDFPCEICGHRLTSRNGLYLHKKAHAGIKNYSCTYCEAEGKDRRFLTRGELRSHWKVHQKPHHHHQQQQHSSATTTTTNITTISTAAATTTALITT